MGAFNDQTRFGVLLFGWKGAGLPGRTYVLIIRF